MTYERAKELAEKYKALLAPYCERIEIAGSVRRKRPTCNDIELVCIPRGKDLLKFKTVIEQWHKVKGNPIGRYTQRITEDGCKLDIFICGKDNWGLIFAIRTGSADYSHKVLANGWVRKGFESREGILYAKQKTICGPNVIHVYEEEELFKLLEIPFIEPEKREI